MRWAFSGCELDEELVTLTGLDGPVHVEPQVFALLRYLLANRHRVVPKEELLDEIWGDRFVSESALTSRVKAARKAVGDDGRTQAVIRTVHGRGYQLVADVIERPPAHAVPAPGGEPSGGSSPGAQRRPLPVLRVDPLGRDGDLATVAARVGEARLVTVTGPGGIGKTTVALAVAHAVAPTFPDGVVFVDLTSLPPDREVAPAVAAAAGLEGVDPEAVGAVADSLASRPALVVLDNCEHVRRSAAELVDRLLVAGAEAHVLTTSREPLAIAGEHLWPLGPLHDAAPQLFVERARAVDPHGTWDEADPRVREICAQLDDLPLALELAAGQVRRFDLDELGVRLRDGLVPLASRSGGDGRHDTMAAAIGWSYRLLGPDEQALLRHLSVFPSSFDLASVERSAPPLDGDPVLALGELVERSLVVRIPDSGRYRLLETIRAFARSRADEAGDTAAAVERHRQMVCARVSAISRVDRWMSAVHAAAFRAQLDDARQAFHASLAQGAGGDAMEIAIGASFLWRNALSCAEGDRWLEALVAAGAPADDELWLRILQADVGQGRGDHRQMFEAAVAGAPLVARSSDVLGAALAAHYESLVHLTDPASSTTRVRAALERAEVTGDSRLVALMRSFLGVAHLVRSEPDEARTELDAAGRAASDDGYDRFIFHWSSWLLALTERDADAARGWMTRQQAYLDRTGIRETWITRLSGALVEAAAGEDLAATLHRTLDLADREGYRAHADCVLALAYAAICGDRHREAAELVGTAMGGHFNATAHVVLYRAVLDPMLRRSLGDRTLHEAMATGRQCLPEDALAAAGIG